MVGACSFIFPFSWMYTSQYKIKTRLPGLQLIQLLSNGNTHRKTSILHLSSQAVIWKPKSSCCFAIKEVTGTVTLLFLFDNATAFTSCKQLGRGTS